MELNECINFLLTKAQHNVFQYLKSDLAKFDVTPVQYGILKCLWTQSGQTPKQMADVLGLDGSTITGILDRMENKKLLKRTENPEDRRTLKVVITDKGLELQKPIEGVVDRFNEYMLGIFPEKDREKFKEFLRLIANR
ncbi:MAG: MarR family transcriptional regulator [Clostridium sp.]|jgi:DNA-binding MarR family transcriptional regulator|uniref:MarR family winged helix-turn-helix transcriptional regulator n=1 Tax=Clostridium sp. TaxID=1506 RepID=UPI0025C128B7|nr:MarR family transcriptional regulator [Clostridium sp.]MCH3965803.1 MarR family transcriptional regulator [Clostridium sp.]MCI1717305.1 MarR family transcriptional regulator [Clostridium sp.]MCI1801645.1 MarR family transcriptional regulator [Clostridium sp.]MCI1815491.1 MarR family transcriptional regulator [Clostridium sp.]MCI1872410.1 MarR family transcriptional regulator [Clostridium sp.]